MLPLYLSLKTDLAAVLRLVNLPAASILKPLTDLYLIELTIAFVTSFFQY